MNSTNLLIILLVLLALCGLVVFIIFLASVAIYQSFFLVAGIILAIVLVYVIIRLFNKNSK